MIRSSLNQNNKFIKYFVIVSILLMSVVWLTGSKLFIKEQSLIDGVHISHEIEINTFELVISCRNFLYKNNKESYKRYQDSTNNLLFYINKFNTLKEKFPEFATIQQVLLKKTQTLLEVTEKLISIEIEKKDLINILHLKIIQIDKLLDEKNMPKAILSSPKKLLLTYKLEIKLSKVIRNLGLYLRTNNMTTLVQLEEMLLKYKEKINTIKRYSHTPKELEWVHSLLSTVQNKEQDIKRILYLHDQKINILSELSDIILGIDNFIDNEIDSIVANELKKVESLQVALYIFSSFLLLFALIFFIYIKSFSDLILHKVENGLNHVLNATQQIMINRNFSIAKLESDDEFQIITDSLINVKNIFNKNFLSKEELNVLSTHFGKINFVVSSNDSIVRASEEFYEIIGVSEKIENIAISAVLGKKYDFSTCYSLLENNILDNINWSLYDFRGREHKVVFSGIILSEYSIFIFGTHSYNLSENFLNSFKGYALLSPKGIILDMNQDFKFFLKDVDDYNDINIIETGFYKNLAKHLKNKTLYEIFNTNPENIIEIENKKFKISLMHIKPNYFVIYAT